MSITDFWWFTKSKRAQSATDDETWLAGGVAPTLNAFDIGDTRATVIVTTYGYDEYNDLIREEMHHTLRAGTPQSTGVLAFSHTQGLDPQVSETATPTLRANGGGHAVSVDTYNQDINDTTFPTMRYGNHDGIPAVMSSTVRRLTPLETERLQGFPDHWTAERYDQRKATVVNQADSARYKQMGNAVAVPVFEWVIARLVEHENQA